MSNKYIFILLIVAPSSAMAYLDPGSGSILIYFVIGLFASLLYSIKNLVFTFKAIFFKVFFNNKYIQNYKNLVFYSEGSKYWGTFKPIVEHLSHMGIEFSYYTSDINDPGLDYKSKNYESIFIGSGRFAIMSLNFLKAKVLVTTTPQLEVMFFKRSKSVEYYVHLVHAPIDVFKYNPFAFDFFDCVMCSGQHQINHLRMIEKARKLPSKNLLKTGVVYFDELLKEKQTTFNNHSMSILIAPTWGKNGLLKKVGFKVLEILLNDGFKVVLRPHPQSFINENDLIQKIENKYMNYDGFYLDKNSNPHNSMDDASILISDASGIIFDFAFIYEKPVISFNDTLNENRLLELFEINTLQKNKVKIWEVENKHKVAIEISVKDYKKLPNLIRENLNNHSNSNLLKFREESIFNFGFAGETASKQLINLLQKN